MRQGQQAENRLVGIISGLRGIGLSLVVLSLALGDQGRGDSPTKAGGAGLPMKGVLSDELCPQELANPRTGSPSRLNKAPRSHSIRREKIRHA